MKEDKELEIWEWEGGQEGPQEAADATITPEPMPRYGLGGIGAPAASEDVPQ